MIDYFINSYILWYNTKSKLSNGQLITHAMNNFIVIIPPILVLALALITRRVLPSLIVGVASASLIATKFNPIQAAILAGKRFIEQTGIKDVLFLTGDYDRIALFVFLILLGILIEIITHTGAMKVYTQRLMRYIKTGYAAQIACLTLSCFFFLDDYLNALVVGSVMRPITDKFKIARAKLAYLINAMASPIVLLIPASSWTGVITTQFAVSGVQHPATKTTLLNVDSFFLLLAAVPFMLYPLCSILNAWFIVLTRTSYGKMAVYEKLAVKTGNLFGGSTPLDNPHNEEIPDDASIADMLIPMATFFVVCLIMLLYTGGSVILGGPNSLFKTLINANSVIALCTASIISTAIGTFRFLYKRQGTVTTLGKLAFQGVSTLKMSLILLLAAWTFSAIIEKDLHVGAYVAQALGSSIPLMLIPLILFLLATLTTASTGSSWGTIMLLTPLALPLVINLIGTPPLDASAVYTLAPIIAALLAGAVAGAHFSPITDATIISSTSARSYLFDHNQTMMSYSLAPFIGTIVGYLIIGIGQKLSYITLFAVSFSTTLAITLAYTKIRAILLKINNKADSK